MLFVIGEVFRMVVRNCVTFFVRILQQIQAKIHLTIAHLCLGVFSHHPCNKIYSPQYSEMVGMFGSKSIIVIFTSTIFVSGYNVAAVVSCFK